MACQQIKKKKQTNCKLTHGVKREVKVKIIPGKEMVGYRLCLSMPIVRTLSMQKRLADGTN